MPVSFDPGVSLFTALSHAKSVPKEHRGGPVPRVGLTVRVVVGSACSRGGESSGLESACRATFPPAAHRL